MKVFTRNDSSRAVPELSLEPFPDAKVVTFSVNMLITLITFLTAKLFSKECQEFTDSYEKI
jgi:hypothetical protein